MSQKVFYPLTSPQLSIWYTEKMFPGTSISNVAGTLRIQANVDFHLLEKAIQLFIKNNDGIRLRLCLDENGNPQQYVSEYVEKQIPYIDFTVYNDPANAFYEWNSEMTLKPFELMDKDLYSFTMVKISETDGGFYIITHHSVSDAWNMSLIGSFIVDYYCKLKNKITDESAYLPKPSYLSFIENDIAYKNSNRYNKDKLFWEQTFAAIPEATILKTRKTNLITAKSKRKTFVVPTKFTNKLKQYCQEYKITPYPLFLSALCMYIFRVTAKEDIVLGTPILNRLNHSDKNTSGMFISTIPLRIGLNAEESFLTLCDRIFEVCSAGYRHQRFPYDQILRFVRDKYDIKENLYDIVLSYQNTKFDKSYEVDYITRWHFNGYQPNSLTIHINDRDDEGNIIIDYDFHEDLYYIKEIDFLHQHFLSLLWHALDNPQKAICKIEMLPESEKRKVLYEFNNTDMEYPREKLIHQLFEEQVERSPDNVAIIFEEKAMTYQELNERANQLAHVLRRKGVHNDDVIGIMVPRSFELIIGIMAILKAGGAFMTLEADYPKERIMYMIENSKVSVLITSSSSLDHGCKDHYNIFDETVYKNESKKNLEYINTSNDLAYVIYTSGTTGFPKGVMIEHKSLHNFVCSMDKEFSYDTSSVVLSVASICFDLFIMEFMPAILKGAKLILANKEQQNLPNYICQLIDGYSVTEILFTPSRMTILIDDLIHSRCLSSLKHIILGGEKLDEILVKKVKKYTNACIINAYGPTESTIAATFKKISNTDNITIGKPILNTKIYILDQYKNPVPISIQGDLYISNECLARGYINTSDLTNELFFESPFHYKEMMYKTGDLARWYPKGEIEYLGRKDKQVKFMGYRIELNEIENTLRRFPHIKDAVVDIRKNNLHRDTICAYYVSSISIQPNEVKHFLVKHLPKYMVPHYLLQIESIPVNINGKRDLGKLPDIQSTRGPLRKYFFLPENELEQKISDVICRLLGINSISIEDDFFEIGADSLTVIQLISVLRKDGYEVNIETIYKNPTTRKLCNHLCTLNKQNPAKTNKVDSKNKVVLNEITCSIISGSMSKLDSAALCYIPYNSNISLSEDKPVLFGYMTTGFGNIGTFLLPMTLTELFYPKSNLLKLCTLAIEQAAYFGAKVVSLTGVLPSATNYGNDVIVNDYSNIQVTTGHATVAATMLMSINKLLEECKRDIYFEEIAILGTESIGYATTELLISLYPKIKKICLFDIEKRKDRIKQFICNVGRKFKGEIDYYNFSCQLPMEFYKATLIIYNINIPEIINVNLLKPGTMLVGVSEPKCFSYSKAIERVIKKGDIMFSEGGFVRSSTEIKRYVSISELYKTNTATSNVNSAYPQIFSKNDITGCIFSSILIAKNNLKPIIGNNIELSEIIKHYNILKENNYSGSSFKIDDYLIPEHIIHQFNKCFSNCNNK